MAKIQIRNARGNESKRIEPNQLDKWTKMGWGKVVVGKKVSKKVNDFDTKGKVTKIDMDFVDVKVEYEEDVVTKQQNAEIESLKKQLAEATKK